MDTRDFYANPTQICMIRKVHTLLYDFLVMNTGKYAGVLRL